ncbi:MAG TPA: transposase [Ktedonobacteraceae bacterium]
MLVSMPSVSKPGGTTSIFYVFWMGLTRCDCPDVMMDNLDTHRSEALVRWIAELEGIEQEMLGIKGKKGILRSMASRAAFLHDSTHRVVFYYTPKHASWMNQVEIWLSILVRKLLKRGNFTSLDDLRDQILAFINYYNRTMAKPIKWTYTGLSPDRRVI